MASQSFSLSGVSLMVLAIGFYYVAYQKMNTKNTNYNVPVNTVTEQQKVVKKQNTEKYVTQLQINETQLLLSNSSDVLFESLGFKNLTQEDFELYKTMKNCSEGASEWTNMNENVDNFLNLKKQWRNLIDGGTDQADNVLLNSIKLRECKKVLLNMEKDFLSLSIDINDQFKKIHQTEKEYTEVVDKLLGFETEVSTNVTIKNDELKTFEDFISDLQKNTTFQELTKQDRQQMHQNIIKLEDEIRQKEQQKIVEQEEGENMKYQLKEARKDVTIIKEKLQELEKRQSMDILMFKEKLSKVRIWDSIINIGMFDFSDNYATLLKTINEKRNSLKGITFIGLAEDEVELWQLQKYFANSIKLDKLKLQRIMKSVLKVKYDAFQGKICRDELLSEDYSNDIQELTLKKKEAMRTQGKQRRLLNEYQDKIKKNDDEIILLKKEKKSLDAQHLKLFNFLSNFKNVQKELYAKYDEINSDMQIKYGGQMSIEEFWLKVGGDIFRKHQLIFEIMATEKMLSSDARIFFIQQERIEVYGNECVEHFMKVNSLKDDSGKIYSQLDEMSNEILTSQKKIFDSFSQLFSKALE